MGRRAYDDDDDGVWVEFELALSRCVYSDSDTIRAALLDFGLTVVRIETVNSPGKMLRETLKKKPIFKISFVLDPADPNSPAVAVDFALSQSEAEFKALSSLPLHRARGATGWRIIGPDDGQIAIGSGP
jgi:hypothetical protein